MDLTGEYEDRKFVVTRPDARISVVLARNEHTLKFNRNSRFIIDDAESNQRMAFSLTKPLMIGKTFNQKGVFGFVMQETVPTDDDNLELGIANYWKYFDKDHVIDMAPPVQINPEDRDDRGRENWL